MKRKRWTGPIFCQLRISSSIFALLTQKFINIISYITLMYYESFFVCKSQWEVRKRITLAEKCRIGVHAKWSDPHPKRQRSNDTSKISNELPAEALTTASLRISGCPYQQGGLESACWYPYSDFLLESMSLRARATTLRSSWVTTYTCSFSLFLLHRVWPHGSVGQSDKTPRSSLIEIKA